MQSTSYVHTSQDRARRLVLEGVLLLCREAIDEDVVVPMIFHVFLELARCLMNGDAS